jgi:hypothetical protein
MSKVRVMVMSEHGVWRGENIPNPTGKVIHTGKLWERGSIIEVEESEFTCNDYDHPMSGKGNTLEGAYRRVDASAIPQVVQPSVFTDPVKTAEAAGKAAIINAQAEAKRIVDEAKAEAARIAEEAKKPALAGKGK